MAFVLESCFGSTFGIGATLLKRPRLPRKCRNAALDEGACVTGQAAGVMGLAAGRLGQRTKGRQISIESLPTSFESVATTKPIFSYVAHHSTIS
jgi:hypothetical protein